MLQGLEILATRTSKRGYYNDGRQVGAVNKVAGREVLGRIKAEEKAMKIKTLWKDRRNTLRLEALANRDLVLQHPPLASSFTFCQTQSHRTYYSKHAIEQYIPSTR